MRNRTVEKVPARPALTLTHLCTNKHMTGAHLLAEMGVGLRCQPAAVVAGATREGGVQGGALCITEPGKQTGLSQHNSKNTQIIHAIMMS